MAELPRGLQWGDQVKCFEILVSFGPYRTGQLHLLAGDAPEIPAWFALAKAGYVRELEVSPDAQTTVDRTAAFLGDPSTGVVRKRPARKAKAEVTDGEDSAEPAERPSDSQE